MNRQSSTVVTLWKQGLPLSQALLLLLLTTMTLQGEPQDLAQQLDKATSAAIYCCGSYQRIPFSLSYEGWTQYSLASRSSCIYGYENRR